ncbi:hypothetical protein PR001_g34040, partial [Phytophthora rubi]
SCIAADSDEVATPLPAHGSLVVVLRRIQLRRPLQAGQEQHPRLCLSRRPDYDPRTVLGRQVIDDEDEDDDHCAVCIASGINLTNVSPEMDLRDEIVSAYADDAVYAGIVAYLRAPSDETLGALSRNTRNQIDRYHLDGDLLCYNIDKFDAPRVVVPNDDDLRARIIHEFHDSPM